MHSNEDTRPAVLEGLFTRHELARDLKCCLRTITRYEQQGLPVIKRGKLRLYDVERVRAWLRGEARSKRRAA